MPSKYDPINKIKAEKPELTWTEAAREAGFEGEFTSYKGKAKPRTGDPRGQARRRAKFDQPSTELAGYEAKQLKQQSTAVSAQAEMFGLEPTQIEHLADQADIQGLTSGAGGDPTNLQQVKQSEARFKDRVKQIVGNDYGVTLNPAQESVKVIPKKFFDPIADPNTLPGVDIPIGSKLNFERGAVRLLSKAPFLGGVIAGAATLASGGTPAQAFGAAVEAENPIENLSAGPLFGESQDFGAVLEQARMQNQIPLMTRIENGALRMFFPQQIRGRSGAKRAQEAL